MADRETKRRREDKPPKAKKEKGDKDKAPKKEKGKGDAKKKFVRVTKGPKKMKRKKEEGDEEDGSDGDGDDDDDGAGKAPKSQKHKKTKTEKEIAHNHKEQKELKEKRKEEKNPNYELMKGVKVMWEKLRNTATTEKKEQKELVDTILGQIEGKVKDVIFQHDSVRVVQSCLKHGTLEHRTKIFSELIGDVLPLAKSKYGKFLIPKMLMYGTKKQRASIIEGFYGHVRALIKHKLANPVVALAYIDFATAEQRANLLQEFYGPQFAVFKLAGSLKTLDAVFEKHPEKKEYILRHLKETLTPLLEKGICAHHIVHRALHDLVSHIPTDGDEFSDLLDTVKEILVEMLHTKDGAMVTARCLWGADAKTRKLIVRSIKPYVMKICDEEFGHFALLALFDTVDDTVLVSKQILSQITADLDAVVGSPYGIKVLQYLLAPRSTKYNMPDVIKRLQLGDGNKFTKKDVEQRRAELRKAVLPALVKYASENAAAMVGAGPESLLLFEIINAIPEGSADVQTVLKAVIKTVAEGTIKAGEEEEKELELAETGLLGNGVGHRLAKRLLQSSGERKQVAPYIAEAFAALLHESVAGEYKAAVQNNRASFVVLSLVEGGFEAVSEEVKSELAGFEAVGELTAGGRKIQELMDGGSGIDKKKKAPAGAAKGNKRKSTAGKK